MNPEITIHESVGIRLYNADVRDALRAMPDQSVHMVVTSPPYWGLRDYGLPPSIWGAPECEHDFTEAPPSQHRGNRCQVAQTKWQSNQDYPDLQASKRAGGSKLEGSTDHQVEAKRAQIIGERKPRKSDYCLKCGAWRGCFGLEPTPEDFVDHMVEIFREIWRVLRDDGTVWLNIGDSYAGSWGNYHPGSDGGKHGQRLKETARWNRNGSVDRSQLPPTARIRSGRDCDPKRAKYAGVEARPSGGGLKPKDMVGIPWMVAFALRADGWYLRSDIVWSKPNCLPESVRDRPNKSHEYIFLLTKNEDYFYDHIAIQESASELTNSKRGNGATPKSILVDEQDNPNTNRANSRFAAAIAGDVEMRNNRTVWTVTTTAYKDAHFAVFPPDLIKPAILAGTSERGCCPECGAPWRRMVLGGKMGDGGKEYKPPLPDGSRQGTSIAGGQQQWDNRKRPQEVGWMPTCICHAPAGMKRGDLEVIASPTSESEDIDDPTFEIGRAGMARPRAEDTGTRPITRYEQRMYAAQLKKNPHRAEMEAESGIEAFKHYLRHDRSGARPIPPALLAAWIERGWLESVTMPEWTPPEPVPATVLDPFTGSGTSGFVARNLGRRFVGIDLNPEYCQLAMKRMAQLCMELPFE